MYERKKDEHEQEKYERIQDENEQKQRNKRK